MELAEIIINKLIWDWRVSRILLTSYLTYLSPFLYVSIFTVEVNEVQFLSHLFMFLRQLKHDGRFIFSQIVDFTKIIFNALAYLL